MKTKGMRKVGFLSLVTLLFIWGCTTPQPETKYTQLKMPKIENQSQVLLDFFQKSGDYINSPESPFLITAEEVNMYKDNYLLLDIRYHEDYVSGHIDGAINIDRENVISFLKTFNSYQYEKIVLIDNTGQGSAYVVSILRAIGYGNAYALKFGMTVWNPKFTFKWTEQIGDKYKEFLTDKTTRKKSKGKYPVINEKGSTLSAILEARANKEINYNYSVTIGSLVENLDDYYIVNYWPKAMYEEVHLKGAIWYGPKSSMKPSTDLSTLPTNKKIVLYCYTGHHSSALAAYLRILGYDAYSLRFGYNSFGHADAISNGWKGFVAREVVHDYALVEGENPSKEAASRSNKIKHPDLNFKHKEVVQPDPKLMCD
jgi:rhodanese-related sulfurtransferase